MKSKQIQHALNDLEQLHKAANYRGFEGNHIKTWEGIYGTLPSRFQGVLTVYVRDWILEHARKLEAELEGQVVSFEKPIASPPSTPSEGSAA